VNEKRTARTPATGMRCAGGEKDAEL